MAACSSTLQLLQNTAASGLLTCRRSVRGGAGGGVGAERGRKHRGWGQQVDARDAPSLLQPPKQYSRRRRPTSKAAAAGRSYSMPHLLMAAPAWVGAGERRHVHCERWFTHGRTAQHSTTQQRAHARREGDRLPPLTSLVHSLGQPAAAGKDVHGLEGDAVVAGDAGGGRGGLLDHLALACGWSRRRGAGEFAGKQRGQGSGLVATSLHSASHPPPHQAPKTQPGHSPSRPPHPSCPPWAPWQRRQTRRRAPPGQRGSPAQGRR